MVIVFRCQNGIVCWLLHRLANGAGEAICSNDGTKLPIAGAADATWPAKLSTMGAHAVALAGPIVETVVLSSVIS